MALSPLNSSCISTDEQLNINIENFDSPEFRESKYILTSPRSLHACDNLGIKPCELASESLSAAFAEIGSKNAKLPIVYQMFSQKEIERKIKISKIRLERLDSIQRDNNQDSINNFHRDYNDLTYHQIPEESPLNSTHVSEANNSTTRVQELELKLALLKEKETQLLGGLNSNPLLKFERGKDYYRTSYLEIDESFDPYFYTKKYPNKTIFDMKSISLAKQADYEESLARTMENSRKIRGETRDYYEMKLANKKMSLNNAAENKERMLAERSLRIMLDREEKLAWKEENLNRSQRSQMMKSLVDVTKIRNKNAFIDAKTRNNALRVSDVYY